MKTDRYQKSMTISDVLQLKHVNHGVVDAMMKFILWGLEPGSFATSILLNDEVDARARAHRALQEFIEDEDPIGNLFAIAEHLPSVGRGSLEEMRAWTQHNGLSGADKSVQAIAKLSWEKEILGSFPFSND